MTYFVTGATGFIGQFLMHKLLARGQPIYVLVRKGSLKKLDRTLDGVGAVARHEAETDRLPARQRFDPGTVPGDANLLSGLAKLVARQARLQSRPGRGGDYHQ